MEETTRKDKRPPFKKPIRVKINEEVEDIKDAKYTVGLFGISDNSIDFNLLRSGLNMRLFTPKDLVEENLIYRKENNSLSQIDSAWDNFYFVELFGRNNENISSEAIRYGLDHKLFSQQDLVKQNRNYIRRNGNLNEKVRENEN